MALLVGPGDAIDPEPGKAGIATECARHFERVDDPERTVEPAAFGLRLAVRPEQQAAVGAGGVAKDIADTVDRRVEPGLGEFLGEPMARSKIGLRIGWPVHAGFVAPELG